MSTSFRPLSPLRMADVFDGRLEKVGIREHISPPHTTPTCRCLTDGHNSLWVYANDEGVITTMSRGRLKDLAEAIVGRIIHAFNVEIANSQDPQYYGYGSQEEMDAAEKKAVRKARDKFYPELIAYVRGRRHGIRPGTVAEIYAQIGRDLAKADPTLLWRKNKDVLLDRVHETYSAEHSVVVTLSEEEIEEAVRMGILRSRLMRGEPPEITDEQRSWSH